VVVLTLPMQSDPCPMFYCKFASPLFPCCPSTSSSRTVVHEGRSDDVMFQSDKFPCHVTVVIRISCFQGMNGVRKLTCKTLPSTCCVSDVAAWVVDSQATPPEAVDLLHRSCLMNMHSALLAYDILSTPTIDAILTYPDVQKEVDEQVANLLYIHNFSPDPERGSGSEHGNKIKAALSRFEEHSLSHQPHQSSFSNLIHMFALMVCLTFGVRIDFYLDVGSAKPSLQVFDIKTSLLAWVERTSSDMDLVLSPTEVLVMYTTDPSSPLDDDHCIQTCGAPSELCAVVSF